MSDFTFTTSDESCRYCGETFTGSVGNTSCESRRIHHESGCDSIEPAENVEPFENVVGRWNKDMYEHLIDRPLEAALRDRFGTDSVEREATYHPYQIDLLLTIDGRKIAIEVKPVTSSPYPTRSQSEQVENYTNLEEFDSVVLFEPCINPHNYTEETIEKNMKRFDDTGAIYISDVGKFQTWDDIFQKILALSGLESFSQSGQK